MLVQRYRFLFAQDMSFASVTIGSWPIRWQKYSYALGCFSLNRTFSIRYLTFGLSSLITSSTSKACIMCTDSLPFNPLPALFAHDKS